MSLILSEIASVGSTLGRWEAAEYIATGIVIIGCVGEFITEFTNLWNLRDNLERRDRLAKRSSLVLIAGLAIELVCLVHTNTLAGRIIAELGNDAAQANKRSVELEAEIQPRYLTAERQRDLTAAMRQYAGRDLMIGSHWVDAESRQLAAQIKVCFNRAGVGTGNGSPVDLIGKYPQLPVGVWGGTVISGPEVHTGVEVWGADSEAIAEILRRIGKLTVTTPNGASPFAFENPGLVTIFVGLKPLPQAK